MKKIIKGIFALAAFGTVLFFIVNKFRQALEAEKRITTRFRVYYNLLNRWLITKQQDVSAGEKLAKKGYKKVAIYGMGEIGQRLVGELEGKDGISIEYAIDASNGYSYDSFPVVSLEKGFSDEVPEVDAIIVTPVFDFDSIKNMLDAQTELPILSVEDLFI